jgi:hypothetical protein
MRRSLLAAVMVAAAAWLTGCGGGGGGGGNPHPPVDKFTRAVVNVDWPNRSRNIGAPSSALSMVVTIKGSKADGTDYVWTINRDVGATASTKRYLSPTAEVKVGTWDVTIKLHAEADGQGAVVGTAAARVAIAEDGTGIDSLAVTGVIATVEVPSGQSVPSGIKKDLVFTTKDASGNIVPVTPGSAVWNVTSGTDKLRFVNGQAESTGNGTATVTATVDNKTSAPATVQVGATSGTLVVNVKDANGVLVKNATVQIFQGTTKIDEKLTATGTQSFTNVPPATIDIKVAAAGYQAGQTTATVTVGTTTTKDLTLVKNGGLIVNVKDPTGSLIANPLIQIFQGGVKVVEKTSLTGAETFTNLAPGATEIKVSSAGFYDNQGTATVVSGQTTTKDIALTPRGKSQASTSPTVQTALSGKVATFQMDVSVRDEFGNPISGLSPGAFKVENVFVGNTTYRFDLQSSDETQGTNQGGYSAFLAMDASESVGNTDRNGSRIQAAKTFFSNLGDQDKAAFGYFPASGGSLNLTFFPAIGFVGPASVTQYYQKLDELNKKTFAGTPLYTATNQAIDYTASAAAGTNKAVVVFTDGKATEGTPARTAMINNARAKGVRIYMVGLGTSSDPNLRPDVAELSLIAQSTGGSVMYATDAAQLVSFYGNLGKLLAGAGDFYRQSWTMTTSAPNLPVGTSISAVLRITLPDSSVLLAPFHVVVR